VAHPVWEGSAVLASGHLGAKAMQCNELHHEIRWGDPVHFAIGKTASTKSAGYIIEQKQNEFHHPHVSFPRALTPELTAPAQPFAV
jgi:hypothetical protein